MNLNLYKQCLRFISILFLAMMLIAALIPEDADARRRGYSRSRSSSSRSYSRRSSSSSRSRSSWGSSSYRRKGGSFSRRSTSSLASSSSKRSTPSSSKRRSSSSSSSKYGSSSTRSSKYGSSSTRSSTTRRSNRYASNSRRSSYDSYRYKRPRYSSRGSWWNRSSSYKQRWRSNNNYRWRFRPNYYSSSYSVGVWDVYFLSHANDLFWYHHWNDRSIRNALYQQHVLEDAELSRLEQRVREIEAQGVVRNSEYLPDDMGPEDVYTQDYIRSVAYEEEESSVGFIIFMSILAGAGIAYFVFFRRY